MYVVVDLSIITKKMSVPRFLFEMDYTNFSILRISGSATTYKPCNYASELKTVCKVHINLKELDHEWGAITALRKIDYNNRYVKEAIRDYGYNMIVFPELYPITEKLFNEKKIRSDISHQINDLRDEKMLHLDVSEDNIMYDQKCDKFILIDFALLCSLDIILDVAEAYGADQIAYKPGHLDPKGLTLDSDLYALEISLSIMARRYNKQLVFAPIGYPFIPEQRPERTVFRDSKLVIPPMNLPDTGLPEYRILQFPTPPSPSESSEPSTQPDRSFRSTQPERSVRSTQPERSFRSIQPERSFRSTERPERPEPVLPIPPPSPLSSPLPSPSPEHDSTDVTMKSCSDDDEYMYGNIRSMSSPIYIMDNCFCEQSDGYISSFTSPSIDRHS